MGAIAEPLKPDSRTSAGAPCGQTGPEGEKPGATPCAPKQERSARTVSRLFSERNVFILCIVIFLVHCVISLFFTPDIYRDVARCYAWYARELGRGTWHAVPISFLPPLTIFLAGSLSFLGLEAYAALKTVSLLFFALTLLPLYRLLKLLGEEKGASWGCLLFIAAPRLLRYSGMALLEPVRDFFLVSAVCLLVKGWKKGVTLTDSLLLGASLGFMSLARSEGMVFAFFLL
ncbi:MAG: glycosyltransferase family 39 protein, partial [Lentisphaeria bacterium]|nr:glycosyltransferase family 39 protein [Lentisphaeria bacterium]